MKINIIILALVLLTLVACHKKKTDPIPTIKAPSATVDPNFGIDGRVFLPGVKSGTIDLLTNEKIVLITNFENQDLSLIRLSSNGSTDNTFGDWGKLECPADPMVNYNFCIQPNGKIWKFYNNLYQADSIEWLNINGQSELVLLGTDLFGHCIQLPDNSLLITKDENRFEKLLGSGLPDNSFANNGSSDIIPDAIRSCLYYKDNVYMRVTSQFGMALRKMTASGIYKSDFGDNGMVYNHELNSINFHYKTFNDFLYVYYSYAGDGQYGYGTAVKRYDLNGKQDMNFGVNGEVRIPPIESGHSDFAMSLEVSDNGDIYIFGSQDFRNTFLYKLNSNGQKELTFGINGMLSIDAITNAADMKIQGKNIYLLGTEKDVNNIYGYSTGSSLLIKYTIE